MSKRENKVTVPLDPRQREFVERMAARDDRTMAAWIRHLIMEAERAENAGEARR